MDAALQDFLGSKPSMETPKPEPQPADTQELASEAVQEKTVETDRNRRMKLRKWYAASAASNVVLHWRSTRNLFSLFRPLKTASLCSLAVARATPLTASSACWASGG